MRHITKVTAGYDTRGKGAGVFYFYSGKKKEKIVDVFTRREIEAILELKPQETKVTYFKAGVTSVDELL